MPSDSSGKVINFQSVKTSIWQTPQSLRGSTFSAQPRRDDARSATVLQSCADAARPCRKQFFRTILFSACDYILFSNKFLCFVSTWRRGFKLLVTSNRNETAAIMHETPSDISEVSRWRGTMPSWRIYVHKLLELYIVFGTDWNKCIYYACRFPSCDNDQDV